MDNTHNSRVMDMRTRDALMSIALRKETLKPDTGTVGPRNSRAVTRTVDRILSMDKDLPTEEQSDRRSDATFGSFQSELIAAQVEDSQKKISGMNF